MDKYSIKIEPQDLSAGDYQDAIVQIFNKEGEIYWAGNIKISRTQLTTWKNQDNKDNNQRIIELGEVIAQLYLNKRILQEGILSGELDFISTERVNNKDYQQFLKDIKNENYLLQEGRALYNWEIEKIWNWTKNDIKLLSYSLPESGKNFPSNGYSIFLFSLMDIWGSIMNEKFGKRGIHAENISLMLKKLQQKFGNEKYCFEKEEKNDLVNILRDNLIHNYGLRVLITNSPGDHPNIDTELNNRSVINRQEANGRWHVNCIELGQNLLKVIEDWIQSIHPEIMKENETKII